MQQIQTGVIAAAGKGTRAYPRTSFIPKPLFRFGKESLLERNFRLLTENLRLKHVIILVGHLRDQVEEEIKALQKRNKSIIIEIAPWTEKGLASDVASLRSLVRGPFALILGDECYLNTNHEAMRLSWKKSRAAALIAIMQSRLISSIRKNYSVELKGERVLRLIEKPVQPPNRNLGLGTYVFANSFFEFFDRTPPSARSGVVELTDVIDLMAREEKVNVVRLKGEYFNINSLADYYAATYALRSRHFNKYSVSLIIPVQDNEQTLPDVLSDFKEHVAEIIVLDYKSQDRTAALSRQARVRYYKAAEGDFSAASLVDIFCRARGEILVLVSADGSFRALDLPRFLEYLKDCDMVVGTRTTRQLIEQGANLRPFYRWMNVFLGKVVELLWWSQEPRYTDIGCAYRAIWKEALIRIKDDLTAPDKTLLTDMMIQIMRYHMRCIEIPVSYYQPYGQTNATSLKEDIAYFFSVVRLILKRRFSSA